MMLGVSGLMGSSGDGAAAVAAESGGASGGSSEVGASSSIPAEDIGGGGNRWPRQETLALLRIRSDMDAAFRDSSLKGPLWEEISRKMAELGFQRSAKKCKEKFENVYKYHKRTKDGRASKSDGKTYRFFDQLEALENAPPPPFTPPPPPRPMAVSSLPMPPISQIAATVPSTCSPTPLTVLPPPIHTSDHLIMNSALFHPPPQPRSDSASTSSTSSDEDIQRRRGKKRKWKDFFQRLMTDVVHKQEDLQRKFLDTLERRERERVEREEAWRMQEMARMNREHDFLAQERSIAAAKDAAVIAFLQKLTDQNNIPIPIPTPTPIPSPIPTTTANVVSTTAAMQPQPQPPLPPQQQTAAVPVQVQVPEPVLVPVPEPARLTKAPDAPRADNGGGGDGSNLASSSRWPKAEVQALINLRTGLDTKYQENGPKGPLWEEISSAMGKMGYNRSSKRCKEKWENINKYFKKVKESSKKRPDDSKTCPYFHQLDAIYKERAKTDTAVSINAEPIMARPEQQWPLPEQQNPALPLPDHESENNDDDNDEDSDEDEGGGDYKMVANKQPPE
ncbi:trihelix transcription factor DF1-like [Salvia hispanica]|uniref:trihelix transcription factor DF1-like n=1 Tax=Salvia hispanica TaxID=49212 RepID=UPI00200905CA|nr:trihelix transcription factor DF1-like [Salvia hispanica]